MVEKLSSPRSKSGSPHLRDITEIKQEPIEIEEEEEDEEEDEEEEERLAMLRVSATPLPNNNPIPVTTPFHTSPLSLSPSTIKISHA